MSPMDEYVKHLLHYLPRERIQTLSCGHVIPPSNLLAMPVTAGYGGAAFDFTFEKRKSPRQTRDLGNLLLRVIRVIPHGVVVFFPSHAYLKQVVQEWQKDAGSGKTLWAAMAVEKELFVEPAKADMADVECQNDDGRHAPEARQDALTASPVQKILNGYGKAADNGAMLLAVIGGNLSEGINFSDQLGRGVVVVGLPFPNAKSAEWAAKMAFIKRREPAEDMAREYYENVCMRAVNQSVGRAIRHQKDYATILLVDQRYQQERIRTKLPEWIQRSWTTGRSMEELMCKVEEFFARHEHG